MQAIDPEESRVESRMRVAPHAEVLALHPDAAPVLRDVCAALHGAWAREDAAALPGDGQVH